MTDAEHRGRIRRFVGRLASGAEALSRYQPAWLVLAAVPAAETPVEWVGLRGQYT